MTQQLSGCEFQLGFAMAGAISAGAYSAGVMDFFLQALEEWEKTRNDPAHQDKIPNHRVGIKVIASASSGSTTGAICAITIAGGLKPMQFAGPVRSGTQTIEYVVPNLYQAWVTMPCMVSPTGSTDFLGTSDLRGRGDHVPSLLNAKLLDEIKDASLVIGTRTRTPLPYVSKRLHVYMMVSNLRGVPYKVSFRGGDYGMMSHGDRMHYVIDGLGNWETASAFADADTCVALKVDNLFPEAATEWRDYAEAALASAAFPAGLKPRYLTSTIESYTGRMWPLERTTMNNLNPNWPAAWGQNPSGRYTFLNVDGGMTNNVPFEYARFSLMQDPPKPNARVGSDVDRAVIMVEPLPEPPTLRPEGKPSPDLVSVLRALFPAMIDQTRFKPSEVSQAADEDVYSRDFVAPHRTLPGKKTEERFAIASGLLGGFGGFLDIQFRNHDYQLGRRNAQRFLRESLAVPDDHPIIKAWSPAARADPRFKSTETDHWCLIPLLGTAADEVALPEWPRMSQGDFETLQIRTAARLNAVTPRLIWAQTTNWKLRLTMKLAFIIAKRRILDFLRDSILSDLIRRDQIAGWELPMVWSPRPPSAIDPYDVRAILAELVNPAYDFRTEDGISAATHLDKNLVGTILGLCQAQKGRPYEVWRASWSDASGKPIYVLALRKPSLLGRLQVFRHIANWWNAPSIG